ncbi:hypothetical protein TNCV_3879581 [Trichonephila clavipes]|nr:hypothetical protein TNCV_3879581 [Trichonephila clavipes]
MSLKPHEMAKSRVDGMFLALCGTVVGSAGAVMRYPQSLENLCSWTPQAFPLLCGFHDLCLALKSPKTTQHVLEVELSRRTPTAASPASQQKRPLAKRQPASPQKDVPSKKQAKSERKLPRTSASPRHIEDSSSMEEGEPSAEESSVEIASAKSAKPVIAQSSTAAKAAESASAPGPSQKDDGFT